jgi:hypothetical protein
MAKTKLCGSHLLKGAQFMQPTFLCSKHSKWISDHPDFSSQHIDFSELEGEMVAARGMFRQAIPYYGCAFDIASIIYELTEDQNKRLRQKIAVIALALYRLYYLTKASEFQYGILERAFFYLYPLEIRYEGFLTESALLEAIKIESQIFVKPLVHTDTIH